MAVILDSDTIDLSAFLGERTEGENIRPAKNFQAEVEQFFHGGGSREGALLPWTKTHEIIRLRKGEVSMWHGENYSGKSTITSQIAVDLCWQGYRVLVASMEMQPAVTLAKMNRQAIGTNQPSMPEIAKFHEWTDERLWIFDQRGTVDWQKMIAICRYAKDKLDMQHIFIDSLMKCVRGDDDYTGQKEFINAACAVAHDCDMHIHIVHHTKKPLHDEVPTRYSAKGSGSISDQVDNVFGVWRRRDKTPDAQKSDCIVNCDKQRNGEWDGHINLWFDPASMQYRGDPMGLRQRCYVSRAK